MRKPWPGLLAEPIIHFTLVGGCLFALHALVPAADRGSVVAAPVPAPLVISAARVAGLAEGWAQAWGRAPSRAELDELIEEEVRGEVFAREAVAQGLDRDDEFIRQHLRERFEALIDGGGNTAQPTEAELEAFFAANRSRFGAGPVVSFQQVLLPASPGGPRETDAALVDRLRRGEGPPTLAGDDDLELPASFAEVPEGDVAAMFGAAFAEALTAAVPGNWFGPVGSSYGRHLVRLDARAEASGLPFAEVRENVREEWHAARVTARRDRFFRDLRAHYNVVVERGAGANVAAAVAP